MAHHEDDDLSDAAITAQRRQKRIDSGIIGHVFQEGKAPPVSEITQGQFVRITPPNGEWFDIHLNEDRDELVITTREGNGYRIGVIFGRADSVHVGLLPR